MEVVVKPGQDAHFEKLLRGQLQVFRDAGRDIRLDADRERRMLLLSDADWSRWAAFSSFGPLPADPPVPVMLRRLGAASYRLAALADRRQAE
jgi:hypothetical protein